MALVLGIDKIVNYVSSAAAPIIVNRMEMKDKGGDKV